ncbi:MAG: hypothetical protein LBK44_03705 [Spirochaetales bacterium]|nr:hypothetical protein [Spirochaetales bacterium]
MRFLWAFHSNPIAQRQLRIRPRNCLTAIPGADNCLWQLSAHNPAVAILEQNCVVCHQARSVAECTSLSLPAVAPRANCSRKSMRGIAFGNSAAPRSA